MTGVAAAAAHDQQSERTPNSMPQMPNSLLSHTSSGFAHPLLKIMDLLAITRILRGLSVPAAPALRLAQDPPRGRRRSRVEFGEA